MVTTRSGESISGSQLVDLPVEVQVLIFENLDPLDTLSIALACRTLHESVKNRLAKQNALHAEYHLQHDRPPKAMLELLRKVNASDVTSRDASWHIRDLELWDIRLEWDDWKSYDWCIRYNEETEEEEPLEPVEDYSEEQDGVMNPGEMDEYAAMIESDCRFTAEESAEWIKLMREGNDEPIRGLLLARAPHLKSVKFIQYDSWQSGERPHPLRFFCTMIDSFSKLPHHQWPVGFQSLQYVSVCASTGLKHPHDMYYCVVTDVVPLFKLPNLVTLHLAMINASSDDETFPDLDLPERCSTVRNLGLYLPSFDDTTLEKVMAASQHLETLTWTNGGAKIVNQVLGHLNKYQAKTIRKIHLPVNNIEQENPYPARLFRELPLKEVIDFPLTAMLTRPESYSTEEWYKKSTEWFGTASVIDLREVFPQSLEKISIRAHSFRPYGTPYSEYREVDQRHSKELFARLLEVVQDPRFKNLKEICCDSPWAEPSFDMTLLEPFDEYDVDVHRPAERPGEWDGEGYESWHLGTLQSNFGKHEADVHGKRVNLDILASDPRPLDEQE